MTRRVAVWTLAYLPAKGYASHSESWWFALALRLASYELLRSDGSEPVLILDDVFAEQARSAVWCTRRAVDTPKVQLCNEPRHCAPVYKLDGPPTGLSEGSQTGRSAVLAVICGMSRLPFVDRPRDKTVAVSNDTTAQSPHRGLRSAWTASTAVSSGAIG